MDFRKVSLSLLFGLSLTGALLEACPTCNGTCPQAHAFSAEEPCEHEEWLEEESVLETPKPF